MSTFSSGPQVRLSRRHHGVRMSRGSAPGSEPRSPARVRFPKELAKRALRRAGYRLVRVHERPVVDLRDAGNNPLSAAYWLEPAVVELAIEDGIGLYQFPLHRNGPHPFVRAVLSAETGSRDAAGRMAAVLTSYYRLVAPSTAAAWLGFASGEVVDLDHEPPWAAVMPWQAKSVAVVREEQERLVPHENRGAGFELRFAHGWHGCGPVTEQKITVEVGRLLSLRAAIRRGGFQRDDGPTGDISAVVLHRGDRDPRWWIHSGHHRAAVASALGLARVPVRITTVVDRAHVDAWPNVVSGVFSRETALRLFDRLFGGELPPVMDGWRELLDR